MEGDFTPEELKADVPGVGTLTYMPPEVLEDGVKYNARSKGCTHKQDMWSLGVIIFNALSTKFPFDHENEKKLKFKILTNDYDFEDECWNGISNEAKDLIEQLLASVNSRLTADQALQHPWFGNLPTPFGGVSASQ